MLRQTKSTKQLLATISQELKNKLNAPLMNIAILEDDFEQLNNGEIKELLLLTGSALGEILHMIDAIEEYQAQLSEHET